MRRAIAAVASLALAGLTASTCINIPTTFRDGAQCSSGGNCPPGQTCSADGLCLRPCTTPGPCTDSACECVRDAWAPGFSYACGDDHLCHYACGMGSNGGCPSGGIACDSSVGLCRATCGPGGTCPRSTSCSQIDSALAVCRPDQHLGDGGVGDGGGGYQPVPRANLRAALLGTTRVILAGGSDSNGDSKVVEAFETTTRTWQRLNDLPSAREVPILAMGNNGRLHLLGGIAGGVALDDVWSYDQGPDAWVRATTLPEAVGDVAGVQGSDGLIYVLGGWRAVNTASDKCHAWDASGASWRSVPNLPQPRASGVAVLGNDGHIYLLGGGPALRSDFGGAGWVGITDMQNARIYFAAAVSPDGRIGVAGGNDPTSGTLVDSTELYSPGNNAWAFGPTMPHPRAYHTAVAVGGKIFVFGGRNGSGALLNVVDVFDVNGGTWE